MVIPTPSFQDLNLSTGWTSNGSPTFVNDLWNTNSAVDLNGTTDSLQQPEIVPDNASPILSYSCWFQTTQINGGIVMGQWQDNVSVNADRGCFFLQMNNNGSLSSMFMTTNDGSGVFSSSVNAGPVYNDGTLYHVVLTGNGNDANGYINGAEVSYQSQDFIIGGGYTSIINNSRPLGIGNHIGGVNNLYWDGVVTRPKIWLQTELTAAQAAEEYANELAAQMGSSSRELVTLLSTPY